jgi:hypothetical protein
MRIMREFTVFLSDFVVSKYFILRALHFCVYVGAFAAAFGDT